MSTSAGKASASRPCGSTATVAEAAALLDPVKRRMRAGIETVPDGSWAFEDRFDGHEFAHELTFRIRVTVKGPDITLDFRDTLLSSGPASTRCAPRFSPGRCPSG